VRVRAPQWERQREIESSEEEKTLAQKYIYLEASTELVWAFSKSGWSWLFN
jgi:hypothetical protein